MQPGSRHWQQLSYQPAILETTFFIHDISCCSEKLKSMLTFQDFIVRGIKEDIVQCPRFDQAVLTWGFQYYLTFGSQYSFDMG